MRCSNSEIFRKLNLDLIDERSEIEFTLLRDLPNCRMINTSDTLTGSSIGTFDAYAVPKNAFECDSNACQNSGRYSVSSAAAVMIYRGAFDAREIAAGVMTFYVSAEASGTVTVLLSDSSTFTNADSFSASYVAGDDQPIMINLTGTHTDVGTGWEPSASGVYVKFTFSNSASSVVGLSSISFFESYEDFETIDVVKVGCLTDISGTIDIPAITSVCHEAGYDTSNLSFTRTVNGKTVTPNYHKLNPLFGTSVERDGSKNYTVKEVVDKTTYTVVIADLNADECGFIAVQRTDACDLGLATLRRVYAPSYVGNGVLETGQYQVIYDPATQASTFYFAPTMADVEILISYPKKINVKRYTANKYNVGDVRVRARYKWTHSDKSEFIVTLPNVLITSFPMNLTRTEQDFSFTMTIQADNNGDFYYLDEVLD